MLFLVQARTWYTIGLYLQWCSEHISGLNNYYVYEWKNLHESIEDFISVMYKKRQKLYTKETAVVSWTEWNVHCLIWGSHQTTSLPRNEWVGGFMLTYNWSESTLVCTLPLHDVNVSYSYLSLYVLIVIVPISIRRNKAISTCPKLWSSMMRNWFSATIRLRVVYYEWPF